jgi:glycosyltransferase involved in cell wall biosynthesis
MKIAYTVALCTHNHADRLVRTLADLHGLGMPDAPWELLVIDNACADATPELLASHTWPPGWKVRIVREEKLGLSNARNCAISEAQGEYVIFIDDDETPDPDWLRAFEVLITNHAPDAFGGRIEVLFEGERPPWLADELLGFLGQLNRAESVVPLTQLNTSFHGGNFGFRKSVCERVGNFDAALGRKGTDNTGGEEVDFYRRLLESGFKVWWTPDATIHHRIQSAKLKRGYFLDLHYRQGRMEAARQRGAASRIPPRYLVPQLSRAVGTFLRQWHANGLNTTVRKQMNVVYFLGYMSGWTFGEIPETARERTIGSRNQSKPPEASLPP